MQQKDNNIVFIGVPFRSGCNREGAQYAPQWIIDNMSISKDSCRYLQFSSEKLPLTDVIKDGVKNIDAVMRMKDVLKKEVYAELNDKKKVIILGGDHSISMGSIAGVLEKYSNVGVIWFDAHTDINTETSSHSHNAHGMPLASLMGLCNGDINTIGNRLNPNNVFWVGVRDVDVGEVGIIRDLEVENHVFTSDIVRKIGIKKIINTISRCFIKNKVSHVHISFDIDGMDPSIAMATGTPVKNGLFLDDLYELLNAFSQNHNMPHVVSMDFVEYNPMLDDSNHSTGKWCIETIYSWLNIMSK